MKNYFAFIDESGNSTQERFFGLGLLLIDDEVGDFYDAIKPFYGKAFELARKNKLARISELEKQNEFKQISEIAKNRKNISPCQICVLADDLTRPSDIKKSFERSLADAISFRLKKQNTADKIFGVSRLESHS